VRYIDKLDRLDRMFGWTGARLDGNSVGWELEALYRKLDDALGHANPQRSTSSVPTVIDVRVLAFVKCYSIAHDQHQAASGQRRGARRRQPLDAARARVIVPGGFSAGHHCKLIARDS
jgi:hypothetical protein